MPRPRKDGTPAAPTNRRRLTQPYVKQTKPRAEPFNTWDIVPGLVLRIQPTGHRSWRYFYCRHRACWYHIGNAASIAISEARKIAIDLAARVARGEDPAADRKAERNAGTFSELAADYVERYAKRNNKSYKQAETLVARYLLPKWGKLKAADIARKDVRGVLDRIGDRPVLSNAVLAGASAVFSWAVEQDILAINPARGIKRHPVKARERILNESEIKSFWIAFDDAGLLRSSALKLVLLTGQRPGEVCHMRREHIEQVEGGAWWTLPGEPDKNGWPGTKNKRTHRVWLSAPARAVLAELDDEGFVFGRRPLTGIDGAMRDICGKLGIESTVRPHDFAEDLWLDHHRTRLR